MPRLLAPLAGALALALAVPAAAQDQTEPAAETVDPKRLVPEETDLPAGDSAGTEKVGVGESHAASREGKPTQDTEAPTGNAEQTGSSGEPNPARPETKP
jgi:hypothetical protein